ncbi:zinc finger, CCHC-type containing protein [Tanacetum coccineum]
MQNIYHWRRVYVMFDNKGDAYHWSGVCQDSLEAKYMAEDASSKKFLVSNFTNYKMTDSRPIMEQYNKLLGILGRFTQNMMNMDEAIQEELTLVEFGGHLRIEESLRAQDSDKLKGNNVVGPYWKFWVKEALECIFVGYAEHSKAFRFYVIEPNESILVNLIIESRDAIFDENRFSSIARPSLRIPNETEDIGGSVDEVSDQHSYCFNVEDDPKTFDEAMKSQDMNVKTAFFNSELDEEVYMNQPQDFSMPGNENKVDLTKDFLSSRFFMKDMGKADVILGIRIKHESNEIAIYQSHYIEKVLKKFNYVDCTPVSTPMDTSEKLMPNNGQTVSQLEYCRVIGYLMYAMTCTRLDLAFAAGKLSRYTSNPGTQHWQEIQRVLKYLKKTMDYRLTYTGYPSVLEGYTDASWINYTKDNSSTSGWVFLLGGAAGKEAEWLKNLLFEISLWMALNVTMTVQGLTCICCSVEGYTDASWISNTEDNSSTSGWVFLLGGGAIS